MCWLRGPSGELEVSFSCAGCADPRRPLFVNFYVQTGSSYFMRRLRGSVPYGIPGRGDGLLSLRRLRRSACDGFFSCLYKSLELIFYALAAGILSWCHFGLSQGLSHAFRGPLIYAQDAWIRLRHFCHMIVYTSGACTVCAGCGDPRLLHFGFSLGLPCGLSVSLWWLFFYTDCFDLCPQTLDRNTCPRTVAS